MAYFLALEAGGTKTTGVLADENRVLATASCGSVRLAREGAREGDVVATERLMGLLDELSVMAGVPLSDITRTCMGLVGVSIPAVREWAERTLGDAVGGSLELVSDEELALDAAFQGGPGILVFAAAGSNVVGQVIVEGEGGTEMVGRYWVGGWGPTLGDEGSAYWIGVEAVKAGLWGRDRGVPTVLLNAVQDFWELESLGELVEKGNSQPDFAELALVVARCAEDGDELAAAVLERAGQELAEQVALVYVKMLEAGDIGPLQVAFTGSVLEEISEVSVAMVAALEESSPALEVMQKAVDGLDRALWRARNEEGSTNPSA